MAAPCAAQHFIQRGDSFKKLGQCKRRESAGWVMRKLHTETPVTAAPAESNQSISALLVPSWSQAEHLPLASIDFVRRLRLRPPKVTVDSQRTAGHKRQNNRF